jgi:hypothetical protein
MMTNDAIDYTEVRSWGEAGEILLRRARQLVPPGVGSKELAVALQQARAQLLRLTKIYDSQRVPLPDQRVVGGLVVERPASRAEAGDELSRRAVARFRRGEFPTIADALRGVMADDPVLTETYVAVGSQ